MPLSKLNHTDRMQLMRFVCSFAWADLEVHEKERALVKRMVRALRLDAEEKKKVEGWLDSPPRPEEIDPTTVPHAHRKLFIDAMKAMIVADGTVTREEVEELRLFVALVK
jgi:uncharacterized tellurite resistance protein B-like protein